jgi:hypothetical protein
LALIKNHTFCEIELVETWETWETWIGVRNSGVKRSGEERNELNEETLRTTRNYIDIISLTHMNSHTQREQSKRIRGQAQHRSIYRSIKLKLRKDFQSETDRLIGTRLEVYDTHHTNNNNNNNSKTTHSTNRITNIGNSANSAN